MAYYMCLEKNHVNDKNRRIPKAETGYQLCRKKDLVKWLNDEIWIAKGKGKKIVCDDKVIFQQAKLVKKLDNWNEKIARLFACDCAEHVLKSYEKYLPDRNIIRNFIDIARKYAYGEVTENELLIACSKADLSLHSQFASLYTVAISQILMSFSIARSSAYETARLVALSVLLASQQINQIETEERWQTKRLFKYLDGKVKIK